MAYGFHISGPMVLNAGNASEAILDQVEASGLSLSPNRNIKASAGDVDPTFAGYASFDPRISGTTEALAQYLAACGISGLVPTDNGVYLYNRAVDLATGLRKTGNNHERLSVAAGLLVPRQLSVSGDGVARLTFELFPVNAGGTTNPVVKTQSVALPSMNGVAEQFYFGKAVINGTELEGVQDFTLDFGLNVVTKRAAGVPYPQAAYIESRRPKLTLRVDDDSALEQIGLAGLAQGGTDSVIYLRKGDRNGVRVADGTGEHISITIDDGIWTALNKDGSHPSPTTTTIECDPVYDGSNAIVVISTTATIA